MQDLQLRSPQPSKSAAEKPLSNTALTRTQQDQPGPSESLLQTPPEVTQVRIGNRRWAEEARTWVFKCYDLGNDAKKIAAAAPSSWNLKGKIVSDMVKNRKKTNQRRAAAHAAVSSVPKAPDLPGGQLIVTGVDGWHNVIRQWVLSCHQAKHDPEHIALAAPDEWEMTADDVRTIVRDPHFQNHLEQRKKFKQLVRAHLEAGGDPDQIANAAPKEVAPDEIAIIVRDVQRALEQIGRN